MLKTRIIAKYLKALKKNYEVIKYIGIAADEPKRIKTACYPMVEWGMTEWELYSTMDLHELKFFLSVALDSIIHQYN